MERGDERAMPEPESPRLRALQRRVAADGEAALEAFWAERAREGTPLIEPAGEDPRRALVTFLWRAQAPVASVALVGGPDGHDPSTRQLARLPGTDLWYRTFRVERDLRTLYKFAVSILADDLEDEPGAVAEDRYELDPLNPRVFTMVFPDREGWSDSVLELPDAPAQPWVEPRPGAPAGEVRHETLASETLGNRRSVWLYTPPGYDPSGAPYPLLVLLDGEAYVGPGAAPTTLDNLIADGRIPPLVAALVGNVDGEPEARLRELACSEPFTRFLATELLPWVQGQANVAADPARTVVGGASLGGLASAFAALRCPDHFGNVLAQSGSFWWRPEGDREHEWLARQFAAAPRLPLRFALEVGRLEAHPTPGGGPTQVQSSRHLRDVLRARGYPVHYAEHNGGHNFLSWRGTLAESLIALLDEAGPGRA